MTEEETTKLNNNVIENTEQPDEPGLVVKIRDVSV